MRLVGRLSHSLSVDDPGAGSRKVASGALCSLPRERMDYFLAICQALGWALAIGALAGAVAARSAPPLLWVLASIAGAAVGALSMSLDDEAVIGGIMVGAIAAPIAALVAGSVVMGAARRSEGGAGGLGLIVAIAAVIIAALCLLISPIALVALVAVVWLALARRRRSDRKYEGLRILR